MVAISTFPKAARPTQPDRAGAPHALLRRLAIRCPVTGLAADTGFELTAIPEIDTAEQLLVDCQECGQDHVWLPHEAFLD